VSDIIACCHREQNYDQLVVDSEGAGAVMALVIVMIADWSLQQYSTH
jgi:hypothetical protein